MASDELYEARRPDPIRASLLGAPIAGEFAIRRLNSRDLLTESFRMSSIARRLAETGAFWSDAIANSAWHFSPDTPDQIQIEHFDLDQIDELIALGDRGSEKTIETSLAHAGAGDAHSERIKHDIRELSAQAGYPSNMVYSSVNDLFGKFDKHTAILGARLQLDRCYIKIHKQEPGQVWPLHIDNYHAFRSPNDSPNADVRRFIFSLTDWCWGQVFQIGNVHWSHWKAGDFLEIAPGVPHSSANASPLPRYSLIATGIRPT